MQVSVRDGLRDELREHVREHMPRPDSVAWKINQEVILLLGWPAAVLFQTAHPLVAAAVVEHSQFMRDASSRLTRLLGTVGSMLALSFGDEDAILATAEKINRIHDRVHGELPRAAGRYPAGERYSAHDPALLLWVHATLLDVFPRTYELLVGRLTDAEKDRYCQEATGLGPLLGIPVSEMPMSAAEVDGYLRRIVESGTVHVTDAARSIADEALSMRGASRAFVDQLFGRPPRRVAPWVYAACWPVVWLPVLIARRLIAALLPDAVRAGYGLRVTAVDRAVLVVVGASVRLVVRVLPAPLRYWPQARRASRERAAERR